jgi:ketosteroid isomerase-like protein
VSQENVEIVRRAWDSYAEGGIEAISRSYADDCILEDIPDLPDARTYLGRAGCIERYWHFVETWGDFSIQPLEFIDAVDDNVVAVAAMTGRGPGSGLPLDASVAFAFELREGKIIRDRVFGSTSAALKAVGLED